MNPIFVSVIIPAYNASATIGRTLHALSKQDYAEPFEVIVVDDGSKDSTSDIVNSFAGVRYVLQDNAGPAAARNHGARLALGEYLAFTDSDCIPHQDWIEQLMAGFGKGMSPASQGGCSLPSSLRIGVVAGSYGIANPESWLARCIYKEILWRHTHLMPDFPEAFGSYNFCIKKSVFESVEGFNAEYRRASGEDNDLSYKIIRSGWKIYFERKAFVDHHHPTSVVKYLNEQCRHGYWRVKMYMDHPRMMAGDGYTFWKDIAELPIGFCFLAGVALSALHDVPLSDVIVLLLFPFLIFEIFWALRMVGCFLDAICFGPVLFLRAFARLIGFSTGFLSLLFFKKAKIFHKSLETPFSYVKMIRNKGKNSKALSLLYL